MELTRKDCIALRGMAIISIFIHNYCHILPNAPAENEFTWMLDNTYYFYSSLHNNLFVAFFSFLGHYGVMVFVFLSGYGLVKKYDERGNLVWREFVIKHYKKLLRLMLPGLVTYLIVYRVLYGWFNGMNVISFITQLLFINNLIPTIYNPIVPGVYWYFGLSLQLYFLYMLFRSSDYRLFLFILVCTSIMIISARNISLVSWLKCNFIGYAIPFSIGMLLAKYGNRWNVQYIAWKLGLLCFLSLIILLFAELNYYLWIFASVPVICFTVCMMKLLNYRIKLALIVVGTVSHLIFVVHPTTRSLMIYMQETYRFGWPVGICIYIVFTLIVCLVFYYRTFKIWERV